MSREIKRYNLKLPQEQWEEIEQRAAKHNVTIASYIRSCLTLCEVLLDAQESETAQLIVRDRFGERQLIIPL